MCLASRFCLVVLLLWQGRAWSQEQVLFPSGPPSLQTSLWERPAKSGAGLSRGWAGQGKGLLDLEVKKASTAKPRGLRLRPRLFWSVGLALAAGGTAWWSGRRADRAYEKYLHSAGRQRQQDQFRRARHYDRVAGTALVFMEAGIVLTTYLVFF